MPETPADPSIQSEGPFWISYAQYGEDILLHRLFPGVVDGFYVDIGANHPTLHSVTRHFYDRGWSGVNVEPVAQVFDRLAAERVRDVNLPIAVSDREGTMTLVEPIESLGMATLNVDFAIGLRADGYSCVERPVTVVTLAHLCERYVGDRTIDFLKIDAEGHEAAVIRGGDWKRWRPRAVVVEATVIPEAWEPVLLASNYRFAAFDGVNRYYLREEDAALLPRLAAPRWTSDRFIPFEVAEARRALEHELLGTRDGLEHARFVAWEARELLARAEARERALREELDRLRRAEAGRSRLGRGALRVARFLSSRRAG
ncbi:FkbM family methyltransferase [Tautonia sociabilis]|uniref:FkbM family methyltransferase n=1 Tax=Tautonia sociabilis TaxID=2080755 RepID=A0A432MNS9_9BACT|nr:FkbM family methyltransferase [Tautonia sociabilis]RUL89062.1 FkbM family methyltransferase [Tautonia sociabilis]